MNFIKKEIVLIIASLLAIITSFINIPKLEYIDFKVLILLFNLMIVISILKEIKALDYIAISLLSKCSSYKKISFTIVFITFFASMIVTNDVALLTFIPLTLIIAKKGSIAPLKIIIFQTLAANLGSSLTPMGNPQNLFIYSFYNISPSTFFKITLPLVIGSIVLLILFMIKNDDSILNLKLEKTNITNNKKLFISILLLLLIILSVFNILNYKIVFLIVLVTVFIISKESFLNVDYSLLLTFIAFFIFIGNISSMDSVVKLISNLLSTKERTFFSAIISSQVISNVPATILLSSFTPYYSELLLGVNIGGLGTLIASLASLISYKLYIKENPQNSSTYIKSFSIYNLLGLAILIPLIFIIIKIH